MTMQTERLFVPEGELHDPDQIVGQAVLEHNPRKRFVLCSGGNDSMVLLHYAKSRWEFDGVVHVNTGTGVRENGVYLTTAFVEKMCAEWGLPLHVLTPPKSYEELFLEQPIIDGLPGPGMHHIAYNRLKERPLRVFTQQQKRPNPIGWRDRIMFLTGIRADESVTRMGYGGTIIDRVGAQVWVNPIYRWTSDEMRAYRAKHGIPQNPVAEHIHISGECLCGCFARPGELDEIRFFFPQTAKRIEAWQACAEERGLTHCQWGQRRADEDSGKDMRLCQQCVGQMEMFE